jgi:hypothetical protein
VTRASIVVAIAIAACAPHSDAQVPASGSTQTTAASPARASMIETLRDLARFISQDTLTTDDVVRRLGAVTADHGAGGSLELASRDPRFSRVQLWRDPAGVPILLDVELAPASRLQLAELRAAFGAGKAVTPSAIGAAHEVVFYAIVRGARFDASLVARTDSARELATAIVFRRDVHVD